MGKHQIGNGTDFPVNFPTLRQCFGLSDCFDASLAPCLAVLLQGM